MDIKDEFKTEDFEGLSAEEIVAKVNQNTTGLVEKKNQLLEENSGLKSKSGELEGTVTELQNSLTDAEKKRMLAEGDIEKLNSTIASEVSKATAELQLMNDKLSSERDKFKEADKKRSFSDIRAELLSQVNEGHEVYAELMLKEAVIQDHDGETVTNKFKLGDEEFDKLEDFLGRAKESDSWKRLLRGRNVDLGNKGKRELTGSNSSQSMATQSALSNIRGQ